MFLTLSLHPLVCFSSLSIQQRHLFCVRWEQGESLFTCTPSPELNHSSKTNARIHSGKPSSKGLKSFLSPPASYTSFGKEVENDSRTGQAAELPSLPYAGAVRWGYLTHSTGPRRRAPPHPNLSLNSHHGPTQRAIVPWLPREWWGSAFLRKTDLSRDFCLFTGKKQRKTLFSI